MAKSEVPKIPSNSFCFTRRPNESKLMLMFFGASKRVRFADRAGAALLVFLLSGLLSLCCCQSMMAADPTEHCPLAKTSHCRFSKSDETPRLEASASPFECCGLRLTVFVAKIESNDPIRIAPSIAQSRISLAASTKIVSDSSDTIANYEAPDYHGPPVHIRNCVFRI